MPYSLEMYAMPRIPTRTFGVLMGAMFDAAFRRFATAFEHRADAVFGSVVSNQ